VKMDFKATLALIAVTALTTGFATREFLPRTITKPAVPIIITQYDTVKTVPEWFKDSVRIWKRRKATTDTLNLVHSVTHVDTEYVRIPCDTAQRSQIRPVLSYHGGTKLGDTASVATFSLRSGNLDISRVYIPGILIGIDADSTPTPKMTFAPFPEPKKPSFLYKLKMLGIGFGAGTVACAAYNTAR